MTKPKDTEMQNADDDLDEVPEVFDGRRDAAAIRGDLDALAALESDVDPDSTDPRTLARVIGRAGRWAR